MKSFFFLCIGVVIGYYAHSYEVADKLKASRYDAYLEWVAEKGKDVRDVTYEQWVSLTKPLPKK